MIIKIGGSLLDKSGDILKIIKEYKPIIIPGGGIFADFIREFDNKKHISDEAAHKMAIYSMNQYGIYLSDISKIPCSDSIKDGPLILLPYNLLENKPIKEYSWEITSDSLSCYVAHLYKENYIILLKSVDGIKINNKTIREINATDLVKINQDVIDNVLCSYMLRYKINCYIFNATDIEKFKENFTNKKYSTKILCK